MKQQAMKVFEQFQIQDIIPYIGKVERINLGIYHPKTNSVRLRCFKKSLKCVNCEREGKYFSLESPLNSKFKETPHLNLYSNDDILMTKDHILPKSKGGADTLDNMQTMCVICNNKKGNKI